MDHVQLLLLLQSKQDSLQKKEQIWSEAMFVTVLGQGKGRSVKKQCRNYKSVCVSVCPNDSQIYQEDVCKWNLRACAFVEQWKRGT